MKKKMLTLVGTTLLVACSTNIPSKKQKIAKQNSSNFKSINYYSFAEAAILEGNYAHALQLLEQAQKADKHCSYIKTRKKNVLQKAINTAVLQQNYGLTLVLLEKAEKESPKNIEIKKDKLELLYSFAKNDDKFKKKFLNTYNEYSNKYPKEIYFHLIAGDYYNNKQKFNFAYECYSKAFLLQPSIKAAAFCAVTLVKQKKEIPTEFLIKALNQNIEESDIKFALALSGMLKLKNKEKANFYIKKMYKKFKTIEIFEEYLYTLSSYKDFYKVSDDAVTFLKTDKNFNQAQINKLFIALFYSYSFKEIEQFYDSHFYKISNEKLIFLLFNLLNEKTKNYTLAKKTAEKIINLYPKTLKEDYDLYTFAVTFYKANDAEKTFNTVFANKDIFDSLSFYACKDVLLQNSETSFLKKFYSIAKIKKANSSLMPVMGLLLKKNSNNKILQYYKNFDFKKLKAENSMQQLYNNLLCYAFSAFNLKKYELAKNKLDEINCEISYDTVLAAYFKQKPVTEFISFLENNYKNKDDQEYMLQLASLYKQNNQPKKALSLLKKTYKNFDTIATVKNSYGYFLVEFNKNLDFAEELINQALKENPKSIAYLDSKAWLYYKQKKYTQAQKIFEDFSFYDFESSTIAYHYAMVLIKNKNYKKAKKLLKLACLLNNDKLDANSAKKAYEKYFKEK